MTKDYHHYRSEFGTLDYSLDSRLLQRLRIWAHGAFHGELSCGGG